MKKSKIYAAGNENLKGEFNISYYILEKDEKFFDWLVLLLKDVFEIKGAEHQAKFWIENEYDEADNIMGEKLIAKDIKKLIDYHEKYYNKGERVDIFYGKERVFVMLRKSREIRKKFASFLLKTKEWIKVDEMTKNELQEKLGRPKHLESSSLMK